MAETPVTLKNGIWAISQRAELWETLGSRLFDQHLDKFKRCATEILKEKDPKFDLDPEERYAAKIYGKVPKYSSSIRQGIAETLALLGSNPTPLINCSPGKPKVIADLTVREILKDADWKLWGSLNNLLPLLAEASPEMFLEETENALHRDPCPFDELFNQEGDAITGGNYLVGLLWALEVLAWDETYLVRVIVTLGDLAVHDPGGTWANRPANSMTTILLPWLPQTIASIEKRKVAIQTLRNEAPEVAWKLLISLLPATHQSSSGSYKPKWRKFIPADWDERASEQEYREQVSIYSDMTTQIAKTDTAKLSELIMHLDHLPENSFNEIIEYLASKEIVNLPEKDRTPVWNKLTKFISKHKKFAEANWALNSDLISKIEQITDNLAPKDPLILNQRLFNNWDYDLFINKVENLEEQQKELNNRRQQAILDILNTGGINSLVELAKTVKFPYAVGYSLGGLNNKESEAAILPDLLGSDNEKFLNFTEGFVRGRFHTLGWDWVDQVGMNNWNKNQIGQFLAFLPFTEKTWERSDKLLGRNENEYWKKVHTNPLEIENNINLAAKKLLVFNRPKAAIECLYQILHKQETLDKDLVDKVLVAAISADEPFHNMETYYIEKIIEALQNDPETNPDDLSKIEWVYLPLLTVHKNVLPKTLEHRLASDPSFFCEVIGSIYTSKDDDTHTKEPTEKERAIASNAYRLLREWKTSPGMQPNATFSADHFNQWIEQVEAKCLESGHLEVAHSHIGNVLIHSPPDPDGLWIHRSIATVLNAKEKEDLRRGFRTGLINSRGMHWVDPSGKPEKDLAAKYRQQGDDVENAGFHRLATTLRDLAETYENMAKQIIEEHKQESSEQP